MVWGPLYAICNLTLVCSLWSAVCGLQSAVYSLQSAVCSLQMSDTGVSVTVQVAVTSVQAQNEIQTVCIENKSA